jgi:hypothetical protein
MQACPHDPKILTKSLQPVRSAGISVTPGTNTSPLYACEHCKEIKRTKFDQPTMSSASTIDHTFITCYP